MARKVRFWIFALLALALMVFIFSNSLESGEESNLKSGWVAEFLRPLLNPFGWIEEKTYLKLVRKLAHFAEFGVFGLCLGGVAANAAYAKAFLWSGAAALLTACADETIQAFTGRTESLKDVCLDFSGAVCGLLFVWLCLFAMKRKKERSV